jgi:hypothetical protein
MKTTRRCVRSGGARRAWPLAAALIWAPAAAGERESDYLRVAEEPGRSTALEVASRTFVPVAGEGPRVALVAVAHIGERGFFRDLQRHLDGFDLVLYESVLPPGARGAAGDTPEERVESTRAAMGFVAGLLGAHFQRMRSHPASLAELAAPLRHTDARLAEWLEAASADAWGNPLGYEQTQVAHEAEGGTPRALGFTLTSRGADGLPGGTGADADLVLSEASGIAPFNASELTRLQSSLARALGLQFQLDAIDYGGAGWRASDMAMDEIDRALRQRDVPFELGAGGLAGGVPEGVARFLLGAVRMLDTLLGGAIADTCKVLLIELLGDERLIEQSLRQLGPGLTEVIVEARNQVVIDDLGRVLQAPERPASVAIFYGAAHMPDMEARLRQQLGYKPSEANGAEWFKAIEVDLRQSAVSAEQLAQLREMVRQVVRAGAIEGR